MLIKTYTNEKMFVRPQIVSQLKKLTNQGGVHDYYGGSAMREDLRSRKEGVFFLMWESGKIIAWALLNRANEGHYQLCCYVQQDRRRQGIGSKLCKKAKRYANKTGDSISFQDERDGLGWDMYSKAGFHFAWRG